MKKTLLTLSLVAVSAVAFGQGRINFNNTGRPITLSATDVLAADAAWKGMAVPIDNDSGVPLPSGVSLVVGLYAGTASGAETLQTVVQLSHGGGFADGFIGGLAMALNGVPAGAAFFRIDVWDSAFTSAATSQAGMSYFGTSGEFTAPAAGASPATPTSLTGATSTWAASPLIVQAIVPEPSTMALAGLGAAALMIFRRRK